MQRNFALEWLNKKLFGGGNRPSTTAGPGSAMARETGVQEQALGSSDVTCQLGIQHYHKVTSQNSCLNWTWGQVIKAGMVLTFSTGVYAALRVSGVSCTIGRWLGSWTAAESEDATEYDSAAQTFGAANLANLDADEMARYGDQTPPKAIWQSPISLESLDGITGFSLDVREDASASKPVSYAGDINGDGIDDVVMGNAIIFTGNNTYIRQAYVVFGHRGPWSKSVNLTALDGTSGFKLNSEEIVIGTGSRMPVAYAGDINGDDFDDIIVGVALNTLVGRSYIIFGHSGAWPSALNLSTLDGTNGFAIVGEGAADASGASVSRAGDINADGIDDVIIGAPAASPANKTQAGRSYVVFGHNGTWASTLSLSALDGKNGFKLDGEEEGDNSGFAVSYAGDVNGDYTDDLIIGAPYASPKEGVSWWSGKSYVLYGNKTAWPQTFNLVTLDGTNGFKVDGEGLDYQSGYSVSYAGDVNNDNLGDIIIGARLASSSGRDTAGRSYVVFGHNGTRNSILDLLLLNGKDGFKLDGERSRDSSGSAVSYGGDINGDGISDIVIGARVASPEGTLNAGRSYAIFGCTGWNNPIDLLTLDGIIGFKLDGGVRGGYSGSTLGWAGDVNGDSFDDIIVGSRYSSYVIFGEDVTKLTIDITLAEQPSCCKISVGQLYNFTFATKSFIYAGASGTFSYLATRNNNTALPSWLNFDSETRTFLGTPISVDDIGLLQIKVAANVNFATISQSFTLNIQPSLSATNLAQLIDYIENEAYNLADIVITTPSPILDIKLILSDPAAGSLTTASINNVTSSYNVTNGLWQANGFTNAVNALLAKLIFRPTPNSYKDLHIEVSIVDSYGQKLNSRINAAGQKATSPIPLISGLLGGIGTTILGSGLAAYIAYKRRKERERRIEIAMNETRSWSFDPGLKPPQNHVDHYCLIPAGEIDIRKVTEAYQRCPVPGMDLRSVEIVYNPNLEKEFTAQVELLNNKEGNLAFRPQWPQGDNALLRRLIMERLLNMAAPYKDRAYPEVKLLSAWHGTRPEVLDSLFRVGYANLAITDGGFFGKGLYSAYEAKYAYQIYSKGALLVNWVSFYSAYPVINGDLEILNNKGSYANYDAHFVPVCPDSDDTSEQNFFPCQNLAEAVYHEIVVFEAAQCLPRYLVQLQPSLPQAMPAMLTAAPVSKDAVNDTISDEPHDIAPSATQKSSEAISPDLSAYLHNNFFTKVEKQTQEKSQACDAEDSDVSSDSSIDLGTGLL